MESNSQMLQSTPEKSQEPATSFPNQPIPSIDLLNSPAGQPLPADMFVCYLRRSQSSHRLSLAASALQLATRTCSMLRSGALTTSPLLS
nr:hypothetical protein Iba_chr03aCG15360 [Ipomoea batatas]GME02525.1 hypothetical protein Iba_scaffold137CG0080 [Ipomoea batatas]